MNSLEFYFTSSDLKDYEKLASFLLDHKLAGHETLQSIVE